MIIVPFIVELIFKNFIFALLGYLFLLLEFLICFLKVVINITGIVSSSPAVMLAPLHKTEPAEAKLALLARHVHTALVLLDQALTLGARLRVGFDPREVLAVCALLLLPDADHGAGGWQVVLVLAREAERVAAFAIDGVFYCVYCFFGHVLATFLRTPFDVLVLICHLLAMPIQILVSIVSPILMHFIT